MRTRLISFLRQFAAGLPDETSSARHRHRRVNLDRGVRAGHVGSLLRTAQSGERCVRSPIRVPDGIVTDYNKIAGINAQAAQDQLGSGIELRRLQEDVVGAEQRLARSNAATLWEGDLWALPPRSRRLAAVAHFAASPPLAQTLFLTALRLRPLLHYR
jgi:hypothetical protein